MWSSCSKIKQYKYTFFAHYLAIILFCSMEQLSLCRTWFLKEPWTCSVPGEGKETRKQSRCEKMVQSGFTDTNQHIKKWIQTMCGHCHKYIHLWAYWFLHVHLEHTLVVWIQYLFCLTIFLLHHLSKYPRPSWRPWCWTTKEKPPVKQKRLWENHK